MGDIPTLGGTSSMMGGPTAKDIMESPNMVCECGNKVFIEGYVVKKVSKILTGTPNDTFYPIPLYVCSKCGKVPKEFLDKSNASKIFGETKIEE